MVSLPLLFRYMRRRMEISATITRQLFVGDVVLLRDPETTSSYIARRLAARDGDEMVSVDEKDEPFVLEKYRCWVLADNKSLKPKEARDSRVFGPVPIGNICGRGIYSLRTASDHGAVENSPSAMDLDASILALELNVEEMAKHART